MAKFNVGDCVTNLITEKDLWIVGISIPNLEGQFYSLSLTENGEISETTHEDDLEDCNEWLKANRIYYN